jgi:uncharacterized membrane protein
MSANRVPALGLLWLGLAVAYLAASALGQRAPALAVLGLMSGALLAAFGHRFAGLVAGLAFATAGWYFADTVRILVFVPPLAAFAFMAVFFGRTLRSGSEPLINRIARKEHPDMPPEVARHTRSLTLLWTACFVTLFLVALVLAPLLALETWSRWVHALGYVVPATLFLGEYVYRRHRFPDRPRTSIAGQVATVVAVMREMALEAGPRAVADGGRR